MKPNDPLDEAVKEPMPTSQTTDQKSIDQTDTEESFSTAADGGNPQVEEENPTETPATGNLPDADTLSDREDSETDSERISSK